MKIVILGGNGFIGSHLSTVLVAAGHDIRVFGRSLKQHLCPLSVVRHVEWVEGDFLSSADLDQALAGCDIAFHLVSCTLPQTSNENPVYDVEANVVGSIHFLEAARKSNVRKVIFVSSGGTVYGIPNNSPLAEDHSTEPICSYGISKLAIEKYFALYHHLYGLDYTIFRLANPYGPYQNPFAQQGVISVFLNKAVNGDPIEIWGDGSVRRDYIFITDAVEAMVSSLQYDGEHHLFNLGSGRSHSLNDIVKAIELLVGRSLNISYLPSRALDVPINVLNITRADHELGWRPQTALAKGLEETHASLT